MPLENTTLEGQEHDSARLTESFAESEEFTLTADEAARLLGVNRSRLSQLTQKGVFLYQRKRVDMRSRLFYRLNDILKYQRTYTYGDRAPTASESSWDNFSRVPQLYGSAKVGGEAVNLKKDIPENIPRQTPFPSEKRAGSNLILRRALEVHRTENHLQTLDYVKALLQKNTEETLVQVKELCVQLLRGQTVQNLREPLAKGRVKLLENVWVGPAQGKMVSQKESQQKEDMIGKKPQEVHRRRFVRRAAVQKQGRRGWRF